MKKFYNDFYEKFGRTVHEIREQQERDIRDYAENGLTEDDIVILTDMDRRRIREIIGEETELNEQGYDSIVSKDKTASAIFKIARTRGGKGVIEFKGGKLTLDDKSARIILDIIAFYPISFTVIIAVIIKITVAVIDLNDKRLMPQIPWPLVQPLPIFVPIPTKKPPIIIIGSDDVIKKGMLFFVKNA